MDTLTSLKVFLAVVEQGSFTAAADQLNLSRAMASKHIGHLEKQLNARLLNRNSRHISLTEAGRLYYEPCRQSLEGLAEAESAIGCTTTQPQGQIRLSAPLWLVNHEFCQLLLAYRRHYPDVTFDIDISGRFVDIVDEGFDLALRASQTLNPNLIARPLMTMTFLTVAAPDYLSTGSRPVHPADLGAHRLLVYSQRNAGASLDFIAADGTSLRQDIKPVLASNNETLLRTAALNNLGIAVLPAALVQQDVASGRLEVVMDDYRMKATSLYAVYNSRRFMSSKVRTFIDFLSDHFARGRQDSQASASTMTSNPLTASKRR